MVCLGGGWLGCRVRINIAITPAAKAENVCGVRYRYAQSILLQVKKEKKKKEEGERG
jgi:hypothetical protein